jgi:hypothetical protein
MRRGLFGLAESEEGFKRFKQKERGMNVKTLVGVLLVVFLLAACRFEAAPVTQGTLEPEGNYWEQVGGTVNDAPQHINFSSLALDGAGNPTVAWQRYEGSSLNTFVRRWSGTSWEQLAGSLNINANEEAPDSSLDVDSSGNPTVAWREFDSTTTNYFLYVKRWNGTGWEQLGGALNIGADTTVSYNPRLALNGSGNPVVAWAESGSIYVKRWNDTTNSWEQLGGELGVNPLTFVERPSLALDNAGNPVVSWSEIVDFGNSNIFVKRWDDSTDSWVSLGAELDVDSNKATSFSSLALDSTGKPSVSWQECPPFSNFCEIYVKRWNGNNWVQLGDTAISGNSFLDTDRPSLKVNSAGNPVVSYTESVNDSKDVRVKRWNGSSWVQLSSRLNVLSNDAYPPSLALDGLGNPVVAWSEGSSSYLFVKRYLTWFDLSDALDVNVSQPASNSVIARRGNNNPVVAWRESDGTSSNVYAKAWNGLTWLSLGGALDKTLANNGYNPSIAVRSAGTVHVAWEENGNIYESFWNNSRWVQQGVDNGGALDTTLANPAATPSLAIKTTNAPVVAFAENGDIRVRELVGNAWTSLGTILDVTPSKVAQRPSLALKSDNTPMVAWAENLGLNANVYAKEWNGTAWVSLGAEIDNKVNRDAREVVLAIGSDNLPVVAWSESSGSEPLNYNIYVKRWDGSAWVALGNALDKVAANYAGLPALDLRSDNNPVVTWTEQNGANFDVFVRRWTGTAWAFVGTAVDKTLSRSALRPSIVLRANDNPIISWDETEGAFNQSVFVRRF